MVLLVDFNKTKEGISIGPQKICLSIIMGKKFQSNLEEINAISAYLISKN